MTNALEVLAQELQNTVLDSNGNIDFTHQNIDQYNLLCKLIAKLGGSVTITIDVNFGEEYNKIKPSNHVHPTANIVRTDVPFTFIDPVAAAEENKVEVPVETPLNPKDFQFDLPEVSPVVKESIGEPTKPKTGVAALMERNKARNRTNENKVLVEDNLDELESIHAKMEEANLPMAKPNTEGPDVTDTAKAKFVPYADRQLSTDDGDIDWSVLDNLPSNT